MENECCNEATPCAKESNDGTTCSGEELAGKLYEKYCESVGGVAFNGDPLPTWIEFRADEAKRQQSNAWVDVAVAAMVYCKPVTQ